MFAVYEFGHQVRTLLHLFVNLINRRVLQFGIQFQVFEIRATAYTSELVEFHHVREVEAHHSAAIKYVRAHFGHAGRNGDSGELGATLECIVGEFLQVVRESDTREIGTSGEHFTTHFTHIPGKRNALKSGATLEAARQLIHPVALEDYLLKILAIGKGCATNDFHRCGNHASVGNQA